MYSARGVVGGLTGFVTGGSASGFFSIEADELPSSASDPVVVGPSMSTVATSTPAPVVEADDICLVYVEAADCTVDAVVSRSRESGCRAECRGTTGVVWLDRLLTW